MKGNEMTETQLRKVEEVASSLAKEMGYQLYGVKAYKENGTEFLEIAVDKDYAISLDEITRYSDALSVKLDDVKELDTPYTLEVASPGAERDFPKEDLPKLKGHYVGILASCQKEEVFGTLEEVGEKAIKLKRFFKGRKKIYEIPIGDITRCRLVIKA